MNRITQNNYVNDYKDIVNKTGALLLLINDGSKDGTVKKIESFGYKIICSFEIEQSYFDDGLILACSESIYNNLELNKFTVSKKG